MSIRRGAASVKGRHRPWLSLLARLIAGLVRIAMVGWVERSETQRIPVLVFNSTVLDYNALNPHNPVTP